jgi:hypothetical protein
MFGYDTPIESKSLHPHPHGQRQSQKLKEDGRPVRRSGSTLIRPLLPDLEGYLRPGKPLQDYIVAKRSALTTAFDPRKQVKECVRNSRNAHPLFVARANWEVWNLQVLRAAIFTN